MTPDVFLEFPGGKIRYLQLADVTTAYVEGLNSPEVNRFLDGVKHSVQTTETVASFVAAEALSTNSVLWGIWPDGVEHHVGTVRIHGIEHRHGTAHIGVCVFDRTVWGKGIGRHAIRAVTDWAMRACGLRWIEAGAFEENIASQKVFLAAGYEWVYDIPGKYLFDGTPMTVKIFAVRG